MTPAQSPSKSVRSTLLMALAGVISIGISPGTLAIVISGTSTNLAELVGLTAVNAPDSKPAGKISSHADIAPAGPSFSGFLSEGLSLLEAASDVDGLSGVGPESAQAAISGLSANITALNEFGPMSFGSAGSVFRDFGPLTRLPLPATLPGSGTPVIVTAAPSDSGSCPENPAEALRVSDDCAVKFSPQPTGGPANPTLADVPLEDFPPTSAGVPEDNPDQPSSDGVSPTTPTALAAAETPAIRPLQEEIPLPATLFLLLAGLPGWLLSRRHGRPNDSHRF